MEQTWFEMREIRRRKLATAVWIPLRCSHEIEETGTMVYVGYREEFYGVRTLAVPLPQKAAAEKLEWSDLDMSHHAGSVDDEARYVPADVFEDRDLTGIHLVLEQRGTSLDPMEWHLHQDVVITLGLKRELDIWVRPDEDYIEVARVTRDKDGSPCLLEVRAAHLRDYLCARGMALYVASYRSRVTVLEDASHIKWPDPHIIKEGMDYWEGRISEITADGHPFGSSTAVIHVARTDVDPEEDVPVLGFPTDENVKSQSWTIEHKGQKLYRVQGELWRNEWIDPASSSPIVRGDKVVSTVSFIVDAEGKKEDASTLVKGSRWLWFRPEVMMALAHRRGGSLGWYTRDTGKVGCSPGRGVHFGVNSLGLVNVFAKDIAQLPEWQQRIWAGYNIPPDGKVSEELLASQMRAQPANTLAPEAHLGQALVAINKAAEKHLGLRIVREHSDMPQILAVAHRFRATDRAGLYALAKDLARLTADAFDAAAIQRVTKSSREKRGSLKSMEGLVAVGAGPELAPKIMASLFVAYDLRVADAHLPSAEADEALRRIRIDVGLPFVLQATQLLHECVSTLYAIVDVIERWKGSVETWSTS